jgi:hypothetical protein
MHQLGTATGAMNFFRQLAGAIIVALFGAIVLGGVGSSGVTVEAFASHASGVAQTDLAHVFQWVFAVAAGWVGLGLLLLTVMEERPLRGRRRTEAVPAE